MMHAVLGGALVFLAVPAFAQSGGEAQYKQKCQMCHGATGAADTPTGKSMKITPFSDAAVVKETDDALIEITKNGKNKMPAYKDKLTDPQIKEVVAYIRDLQKKK